VVEKKSVIKDRQLDRWNSRGILHGFSGPEAPPTTKPLPVRVQQVHGNHCLEVSAETPSPAGESDALISLTPGVAVAIATADCVPILLSNRSADAVAAIHAGWRGTLQNIAAVVVGSLGERGIDPQDLEAAIGPAIGPCCFEVESEFEARFVDTLGVETRQHWQPGREGHGALDLPGLNRMLLTRAGVPEDAIHQVGPCTFCGGDAFASYRRDGEAAGRQISWIRAAR